MLPLLPLLLQLVVVAAVFAAGVLLRLLMVVQKCAAGTTPSATNLIREGEGYIDMGHGAPKKNQLIHIRFSCLPPLPPTIYQCTCKLLYNQINFVTKYHLGLAHFRRHRRYSYQHPPPTGVQHLNPVSLHHHLLPHNFNTEACTSNALRPHPFPTPTPQMKPNTMKASTHSAGLWLQSVAACMPATCCHSFVNTHTQPGLTMMCSRCAPKPPGGGPGVAAVCCPAAHLASGNTGLTRQQSVLHGAAPANSAAACLAHAAAVVVVGRPVHITVGAVRGEMGVCCEP